uniref:Uncharacterized protein n=1 Tax=Chromera velia CCMP2878 TaxID=1169474 RepID=A0A0G4FJG5_9ALVE|eukprot:Cvel_17156.t1-p1 / transcript=Cvel_17156.t1 / gene=Cvel_17156 / organism=Chromera_velia_CCMP2878 / gene_product=hypothetical protein / transcript_product=hypothetical protein / location=Cvel_scaffold1355:43593-46352(-) / protein_length=214 / sequence_SO=supercontig / SO=protein_coding / is_pseudo=false
MMNAHSGEAVLKVGDGPSDDRMVEKSAQPSIEMIFCKLLEHTAAACEVVVASSRESFGIAWLSLFCMKKKTLKGVRFRSLHLPDSLDLSPKKAFFLLHFLPASTEELKFGPSTVKVPALPLLPRFLEGLARASGEGGQSGMRIKRLIFAEGSVGPQEAPVVFGNLPPSLEALILKGNPLSFPGIKALGTAVKAGRVAELLTLDLSNAQLNGTLL